MKRPNRGLLTMAVAAMLCGACGSEPATPAASAPAAPKPVTAEERVKWYQDCWNLFNTKSWDGFKDCYASTAVAEQVDSGQPNAVGSDAIVASSKAFDATFPDMKGAPQIILINGTTIASLYLLNATHSGPLPGPGGKSIPATNKKVGYVIGHVVQAETAAPGKATREWLYADNGTMMAQLGLAPAMGRPITTDGAAAPTIVIASNADQEMRNVQAFRAQADLFNKHDVKALMNENAPGAVFHDYTQAKDVDASGNAAAITGMFKGFPDARINLTTVWGAGDYVVTQGSFEGTNKGPVPDMGIKKATGKSVKVQFLEITKLENAKVKEDWLIFDSMAFSTQLGLSGN